MKLSPSREVAKSQETPLALVSVVIPCRNEERFIRRCLDSILSWDLNGYGLEIWVVDGRSADMTRQIVREFEQADPRIHLLDNPDLVQAAALNVGIRHARGQWIIRLDAHSEYPSDYFRKCMETAQRTGAENVGGVFVPVLRENTVQAHIIRALTTHRFGVGGSAFRTRLTEGPADTVAYGCYRHEVFDRVGGFDERLPAGNEDYEFNQRLLHAGGSIWLNPSIEVFYYNQATLKEFLLKVLLRDGPNNPGTWYAAPYSFRLRHAIPMCFVLALICSGAAAWILPWGWTLIALILVPYGLLAVISAAQQARRYHKWYLLVTLPWLFFAYHLAHGFGGLWGVLRLLLRNSPVQQHGRQSPVSQ